MNLDPDALEPMEAYLKSRAGQGKYFPAGKNGYFDRYWQIKTYLNENVYSWIGAGTSAEDQGVYTDHSIDHFHAVIRLAGKLIGLNEDIIKDSKNAKANLDPYEIYMALVSILLHDAGNINGRRGHEKRPLQIFINMGDALCPDHFEARIIAKIAEAHGGQAKDAQGNDTKDTIRNSGLADEDTYGSIRNRPKTIAALVRFADEVCEDRTRAAHFLLKDGSLPEKSQIFHKYADSISSVEVDRSSKRIRIKYELWEKDILVKFGKDDGNGNVIKQFLIDEINTRLEKMFCELLYCMAFMYDISNIREIRAEISIYDDTSAVLKNQVIELVQSGYPTSGFSFSTTYPEWAGSTVLSEIQALKAK